MAERASELISHDIRAAMEGLLGGLSQVSLEALSETDRSNLERVRASAELLDALLLLAKGDSETAIGSASDLGEIFEILRRRWTSQAREMGIQFVLEQSPEFSPALRVPSTDLLRTLNNIIGNAIKYTDAGTVTINCGVEGNCGLCICITDEGPGFSEGAISQLFEFGGRPTDALKAGTGLGLHIAQSLMRRHDASIEVENQQRGATVKLLFPKELCAARDDLIQTGDEPLPDLGGVRVLVAEDNVTSQFVVGEMLKKMGAEICVVSDGVEALDAFDAQEFDIALLDVEMPRKSGLAVIREIRARSDERAKTPLVVLTAYVLQEQREAITQAGADGILSKPVRSVWGLGTALLEHLGREVARLPEEAVVDLNVYDQLMTTMGEEPGKHLLVQLLSDLGAARSKLEAALPIGDMATIRAQTHILVSAAGAIGGFDTQFAAQALNESANSANVEKVAKEGETCMTALSALIEFVEGKQIQVE